VADLVRASNTVQKKMQSYVASGGQIVQPKRAAKWQIVSLYIIATYSNNEVMRRKESDHQ